MEFISIEYQRVICDESERSENDFNYVQSGYLSDFHRSTLVNWLFELGEEYKFTPETNHLCIIIMDRYMARYCKLTCGKKIPTSRLQLIACGSMLLASKLNVSFRSFSAGQIFLIRRDIQRKFQTLLIPVPTNMMKINSKEFKPKYSKRSNGISTIQEQITRIDYWRSSSSGFMKSNFDLRAHVDTLLKILRKNLTKVSYSFTRYVAMYAFQKESKSEFLSKVRTNSAPYR